MTDNSTSRRLIQLGALLLIADGVSGIVMPRRRSLLWYLGPQIAKAASEELAEHPSTARIATAAKTALGGALLTR